MSHDLGDRSASEVLLARRAEARRNLSGDFTPIVVPLSLVFACDAQPVGVSRPPRNGQIATVGVARYGQKVTLHHTVPRRQETDWHRIPLFPTLEGPGWDGRPVFSLTGGSPPSVVR